MTLLFRITGIVHLTFISDACISVRFLFEVQKQQTTVANLMDANSTNNDVNSILSKKHIKEYLFVNGSVFTLFKFTLRII